MATIDLTKFTSLVATLSAEWQKVKPVATTWLLNKGRLSAGFQFLAGGIDQLVALAETMTVAGVDKKAAVVAAANTLFDVVVMAELPAWTKPFIAPVKGIFDTMLDGLIEFVVAKLTATAVKAPQVAFGWPNGSYGQPVA